MVAQNLFTYPHGSLSTLLEAEVWGAFNTERKERRGGGGGKRRPAVEECWKSQQGAFVDFVNTSQKERELKK